MLETIRPSPAAEPGTEERIELVDFLCQKVVSEQPAAEVELIALFMGR